MGKRLITQRRGNARGSRYRSPSHRHISQPKLPTNDSQIVRMVHAPGRRSPLALLDTKEYILCPQGIEVGHKIQVTKDGQAPAKESGNVFRLRDLHVGDKVHNVESKPMDGGKFVRAAGTSASILKEGEAKVVIQFPNGKTKAIDGNCRCAYGVVAGAGLTELYIGKAGKKKQMFRSMARTSFKVSGIAMNPVDHPHGGGNHPHVGRPSTLSRNASPGSKVGNLSPQSKKKKNKF